MYECHIPTNTNRATQAATDVVCMRKVVKRMVQILRSDLVNLKIARSF
jgi:hypothetical protein